MSMEQEDPVARIAAAQLGAAPQAPAAPPAPPSAPEVDTAVEIAQTDAAPKTEAVPQMKSRILLSKLCTVVRKSSLRPAK